MNCEVVRNNISAFLDDELPADENDAILQHLAECPACKAEKDRISNAAEALKTIAVPELKSNIFLSVSKIVERNTEKSYAALTGTLQMFGALAALAVTVFLFSPTGGAVVGIAKTLFKNAFTLGSLVFRIPGHLTVEPVNWLSLGLFLGFLLTLGALRIISNSSSLGGPVHE